ncbi:5104_t:CDS:2 [Scutellospora calospora]|uniref:5104_t:CDS:1 n=1 Tax=Scutellospora calospora TaxID=85575 RepID=A0ACA9LTE1_9GLOM|nr:5104_t:CDS:2 [Scutellospora calospora]
MKDRLKNINDTNSDLQTKIINTERELEASNKNITVLNDKIKSLEEEIKILDKQRIKDEERKKVLKKLNDTYKDLQDTCNKIRREKIDEETKKYKDILKDTERSLNDNDEFSSTQRCDSAKRDINKCCCSNNARLIECEFRLLIEYIFPIRCYNLGSEGTCDYIETNNGPERNEIMNLDIDIKSYKNKTSTVTINEKTKQEITCENDNKIDCIDVCLIYTYNISRKLKDNNYNIYYDKQSIITDKDKDITVKIEDFKILIRCKFRPMRNVCYNDMNMFASTLMHTQEIN